MEMERLAYTQPEFTVVRLDSEDVLTESVNVGWPWAQSGDESFSQGGAQ